MRWPMTALGHGCGLEEACGNRIILDSMATGCIFNQKETISKESSYSKQVRRVRWEQKGTKKKDQQYQANDKAQASSSLHEKYWRFIG